MAYRISVDTGGTFTDVVVSDAHGRIVIGKALTVHERTFDGISAALDVAAAELGLPRASLLAQAGSFIYGTTRAINAVVTKRTARTALLTTEGFPDILVFREGGKADPSDFTQDFPQPYIPRRQTFEVPERILHDGRIALPLDESRARALLADIGTAGYEAIAVSLIWSVANPAHELLIGRLADELLPGVPYTLSHQLLPIVREYRRASATAVDASLKPLMQRHFRDLEIDLRAAGYRGEILVSTSVGGCMNIDQVIARPIHVLKSGPAMAPVAAQHYAGRSGLGRDIIVADTGGTTFDVGLVRDGNLVHTRDTWLGQRWVGDLVSLSTVDVRSIGAGGGSIAWVDEGGLLRVGPQSAGSVPGPACYGRGGEAPTVTDAAVVLGYIDPEFFVGGRLPLDAAAAHRVVETLARQIGHSPLATAAAILQVANELMIKAIGELTVSEGIDPAESAVVAGGGAAGLNILPIARELGCTTVLLPRTASALSACGMQVSDIVSEHSTSVVTDSARFDTDRVAAALDRIDAELDAFIATLPGITPDRVEKTYFAEARYRAQVWELETPLAARRQAAEGDVAALQEAFHQVHERVYAMRDPASVVEFINWKGRVSARIAPDTPTPAAPAATPAPASSRRRAAYFHETGLAPVAVYRGHELPPGSTLHGPAIIEEPTTTLVIYPGMRATISAEQHVVVHIPREQQT